MCDVRNIVKEFTDVECLYILEEHTKVGDSSMLHDVVVNFVEGLIHGWCPMHTLNYQRYIVIVNKHRSDY